MSFSKNSIIYLLGGVVAAGGNFLLAPMYLRLLNAEDYGAWSEFGLILQFLQPLMAWGLMATMARLMVDASEVSRKYKIASALKMVTVLNIGLLLVVLGFTQQNFFIFNISNQRLNLLLFAAVAAALAAYPSILMGIYVADSKALQYRSLSLVGFALQAAVLGVCASLFFLDIQVAITAMIGATFAYGALSAYQLARSAKWDSGPSEYRELMMFGGPVVFYTIAGQTSEFFTKYILATSVSSMDFGAFSAGVIYASLIAMVSSAINLAWVPLFYRRADKWIAEGIYGQFVDVFSACTAVFAGFLIIFSDELLAIYSGGKITLNVSIVGLIAISCWLNSAVWMSLSNPLFYQKRSRVVLGIVLLAIVLSMPFAFLLIARHGLYGASLALFLNAFALCLIATQVLRKLGVPSLNYAKLAIIFLLLIIISSPIMNIIYNEPFGLQRLAEKSLIFSVFAAAILLPLFGSCRNVLRVIEASVTR